METLASASTWNADTSYGPITGSGAEKLAASRVAPLVAHARGYETLRREGVKDFVRKVYNKPLHSAAGGSCETAVGDKDALVMPWFRLDTLSEDGQIAPSMIQYRPHPAHAVFSGGKNSKRMKYVNSTGDALVLDVHPSHSPLMVGGTVKRILITEGLLKADSALTAYLLTRFSVDDLRLRVEDTDALAARLRLRQMLESFPEEDRVIIIGVVGVGTWHNQGEWNALRLKGAEAYVAFDGDVATNINVWNQANAMFRFLGSSKHAQPYLLDLSSLASTEKMGVDDFFAHGGTWEELLRLSSGLPSRPVSLAANDLKVKVADDGLSTLKRVDTESGVTWVRDVGFGGRVLRIRSDASLRQEDEDSGQYRPSVGGAATVDIEVRWLDSLGEEHVAMVQGSEGILAQKPEAWLHRGSKTKIDGTLLAHPEWPPIGYDWLKAVKAHRADEREESAQWGHMGWVPQVGGGTPVFLIGEQVVSSTGFVQNSPSQCSVTEDEMDGVSRFGVALPDDDAQALEDLRTVVRTYMAAWTNPVHAAIVLSAGIRPTIPVPCRVPIVLSGKTGSGKSFTSAACLGFWQARPGAWTSDTQTGGANDTYTATEIALHQSVIWVVDDLAPSSGSQHAQSSSREVMNTLLRNVHNTGARRRSNVDLKGQPVMRPRALLLASCEAPPEDPSILNRIVHIEVAGQFLVKDREPTDALEKMNKETETASRVTGRVLQMLARQGSQRGWPALTKEWRAQLESNSVSTAKTIKMGLEKSGQSIDIGEGEPDENDNTPQGSFTRLSRLIADLTLGLDALIFLAVDLGDDDLAEEIADLKVKVQESAIEAHREVSHLDAANEFMSKLRGKLYQGSAHIKGSGVPGPPFVANDDPDKAESINQRLGWFTSTDKNQVPTPKGRCIGELVYRRGEPIILFEPVAAWEMADITDGHTKKSMWDLVWASNWVAPGWLKPKTGHSVRTTVNSVSVSGVPVALKKLLR